MAKRISELTAIDAVAGDDLLPVVDVSDSPDETKKATGQQLVTLATTVGTFASRPSAGVAGRRFIATDPGYTEWVDDGSAWRPLIGGNLGKQPPAASNFTLVQASGLTNPATLVDSAGALKLSWTGSGSAGSGEPVRFAYKAAPSSGATGYRVVAHLSFLTTSQNGTGASLLAGVGFRQSSNGSIELLEAGLIGGWVRLSIRRYTASGTGNSPSFTFSAQTIGTADATGNSIWVRVERTTSGNRAFDVSYDGFNWKRWSSASSTANTFITPDQVFLEGCMFSDSGNDLGGVIYDSYEEIAY